MKILKLQSLGSMKNSVCHLLFSSTYTHILILCSFTLPLPAGFTDGSAFPWPSTQALLLPVPGRDASSPHLGKPLHLSSTPWARWRGGPFKPVDLGPLSAQLSTPRFWHEGSPKVIKSWPPTAALSCSPVTPATPRQTSSCILEAMLGQTAAFLQVFPCPLNNLQKNSVLISILYHDHLQAQLTTSPLGRIA